MHDALVGECTASGQVWAMEVAEPLDMVFAQLLASGPELAQVYWREFRAA